MSNRDPSRPRPKIRFSVLLQDEASPCGSCGQQTEPGPVGWYQGKDNGPLCLPCLFENAPELASIVATAQLVREVGESLREGRAVEGQEAQDLLRNLAQHYEGFAGPRWLQRVDSDGILRMIFGAKGGPDEVN